MASGCFDGSHGTSSNGEFRSILAPRPGRVIGRDPDSRRGQLRVGTRSTADVRRPARWDRGRMPSHAHPVLIGIDGRPAGLEALTLGGALAVLTGAPLVLGAVFGTEAENWPPEPHADQWLAEAAQRLGDGIPWSTRTIFSTTPGHGLAALARSLGASWVVLGAGHHGAIGRGLLGSTARAVIHEAPCGVAVVPHGWRVRPPDAPLRF